MTEILAVHPRGGEIIHLVSPGYQPGRKKRSADASSGMCGGYIGRTEGRTVPLADARDWPTTHGDCPVWTPQWRWCNACLGHAAVLTGRAEQVIYLVLDAITPCSCEGRRWVEDENYRPEDYEMRDPLTPGKGLIPCGRCNHGGWHVDEYEMDTP